jgi:hypothetical protein
LSKTYVICPDSHAHYQFHNKRAEWLGKLVLDVKPDVFVHMGDSADMPSLSSYEKGKKSFQGRTFRADINAHLDFQDRLWSIVKSAKKKLPQRIILEGNHEHRIKKAIEIQPELEGTISGDDLQMLDFYDQYVEYDGRSPGVIELDGITFAHFFISGVMGKPIGGIHPAYSILAKGHTSAIAGDLHLLDYCVNTSINGKKLQGIVAGCFQDYDAPWAGKANDLWWRGVIVLRNVENGNYDPQFISIDALKKEYS